jgi:hypothetical protein
LRVSAPGLKVFSGLRERERERGERGIRPFWRGALNILAELRYENTLENEFSRFTGFTSRPEALK